jgi:hypothetical protein
LLFVKSSTTGSSAQIDAVSRGLGITSPVNGRRYLNVNLVLIRYVITQNYGAVEFMAPMLKMNARAGVLASGVAGLVHRVA